MVSGSGQGRGKAQSGFLVGETVQVCSFVPILIVALSLSLRSVPFVLNTGAEKKKIQTTQHNPLAASSRVWAWERSCLGCTWRTLNTVAQQFLYTIHNLSPLDVPLISTGYSQTCYLLPSFPSSAMLTSSFTTSLYLEHRQSVWVHLRNILSLLFTQINNL